jgi:branched-chain amino acid transport system substrate-binding protein
MPASSHRPERSPAPSRIHGAARAGWGRRQFLRWSAATGGALALPPVVAGCRSGDDGGDAGGDGGGGEGRPIKLGYVSPQTGALAGFGEADEYILEGIREVFADGLEIDGTAYPVEILVADSQSDPNRAATVAGELITGDEIDLMLVAHTPENANPVSDQCEANQTPCISSVVPWQPWFFGRDGNPDEPFEWTYHFFWGLEDIIAVFTDMWSQVETNQQVAALWPNDGDGNAWGDPETGFPPALAEAGYTVTDPGRYTNGTDDFSTQISQFRSVGTEIVTGVPVPPDFANFWAQAVQQGYRPRIASVGKALLFPSAVEALGDTGAGLSTEVWWSPSHPFSSSLTGASAGDLAGGYTEATGRQWTQPLGFVHALFEVAADVLVRAGGPDDRAAVAEAIAATSLDTIVGLVDFSAGPVPGVAKTPLVGGQWREGEEFPYELVIVSNSLAPDIPAAGQLEPIEGS